MDEDLTRDLCTEVAELVATFGWIDAADGILEALVAAGCYTKEKGILGQMYMRMLGKQYDPAIEFGRSAFDEDNGLHKVAYLLGQLYQLVDDEHAARNWYAHALRADATAPWRQDAVQMHAVLVNSWQRGLAALDITNAAIRA